MKRNFVERDEEEEGRKRQKTSNFQIKSNSNFSLINDDSLMNILSFLTSDDVFQNLLLVCKKLEELVYLSTRSLYLAGSAFDSFDQVDNVVKRFHSLTSLSIDGFDLPATSAAPFNNFLSKVLCEELQISQTETKQVTLLKNDSLKVLRLDNMQFPLGLTIQSCQSLHTIEFYNCDLQCQVIDLTGCYQLTTLKFFKCNLTDKRLHMFLKCLLSPQFVKRVDEFKKNSNASSTRIVDKTVQNDSASPPCEHYSLCRLIISECEELTNPVIQSETLQDVRIINCRSLNNPFISCAKLKRLQLNWCENLENITLAATPNLELIDITEAGRKDKNLVRENILKAVQTYKSTIKVIY